MWACRSFLRRREPLTSCLRPVRRHDATQAGVLLGRNLTASRGYNVSDATNRDLHQPQAAAAKRHLYLLLDDHEKNYGIYRMDVDADLDDEVGSKASDLAPAPPRRLPRPAVIRLEVPGANPQFVAENSCIIGKGCFPFSYWSMHLAEDDGSSVVYDIKTATVSISISRCGLPKNPLHDIALACDKWCCIFTDSRLPFLPLQIQAYAVHPREGTIFVSAPPQEEGVHGVVNTFSYDTETRGAEWMHLGSSALPFRGQTVYDGELDSWLGFHANGRGKGTGRLVACRVPSHEHQWPPQSQRTAEKMLLEDPGWRRVDAKLVHMVERGEYCLVERLRRKRTNEKKRLRDGGDECLLRLTMFRVGVEHNGLGITDRRSRCYNVSRYRQSALSTTASGSRTAVAAVTMCPDIARNLRFVRSGYKDIK